MDSKAGPTLGGVNQDCQKCLVFNTLGVMKGEFFVSIESLSNLGRAGERRGEGAGGGR